VRVEARDELLGLLGRHAELQRQRARPLPGEGGEVHDLAELPVVGAQGLDRPLQQRRRGEPVDVLAPAQRLDQRRVLREVREHVQPELVEVDRHQHPPRRRDEGAPDHLHLGRAPRDPAQVRAGVDQAAGERARDVEARVHAAVDVDAPAQRDHPAVAQAPEQAPADHERHDRVRVLDPLQRLGRGAPPGLGVARDREAELREQHVAELLGRVDVEPVAGQNLDARGQVGLDVRERPLGPLERRSVDGQAGELHAHAGAGQLEVLGPERGVDVRRQRAVDRAARVRGQPGELRGAGDGQRGPGPALLPDAALGVLVGEGAAEHVPGDAGEVVGRPVARLRQVRDVRRVAGDARELDAGPAQRDDRGREIVAELRRRGVLEPRDQCGPGRAGARHVDRVARPGPERHAGQGLAQRRRILDERVQRDRAGAQVGEHRGDRGRRLADLGPDPRPVRAEQFREAEPLVELVQRRRGRRRVGQALERDRQRPAGLEPGAAQLARQRLAGGAQRGAGPALDGVLGRERRVDRAVGREQRRGALGAEPRDPGERVVVADEGEPLGDLRRRDPEALVDDLGGVARVLVGVVPPEPLAHELGVALVDADDDRVVAVVEGGLGIGRDQVHLA
jgi:hypothetical protein